MTSVAIGIDIGGTNTAIGIVDQAGTILAETSTPTEGYPAVEDYVAALVKEIEALKNQTAGELDIKGIGIGAPNANYLKGTIENAPNLEWKGIVHFAELFKKYYSFPVVLTNDANAATIGEMMYGKANGMNDFVMITLGTGLGSGIVSNGEMIYGHDGFAGEVGHTLVEIDGRQCGCGKKGCLETYVSATGLTRTMLKVLCESNQPSDLRKVAADDITSKQIFDAASAGDPLAKEAFDYTGKVLGTKLADTVAHTSPEAIFLFGGMAKAGDLILEPTKKAMEENLLPIFRNKVKIEISGLQDKNAAILGASALIWKELN